MQYSSVCGTRQYIDTMQLVCGTRQKYSGAVQHGMRDKAVPRVHPHQQICGLACGGRPPSWEKQGRGMHVCARCPPQPPTWQMLNLWRSATELPSDGTTPASPLHGGGGGEGEGELHSWAMPASPLQGGRARDGPFPRILIHPFSRMGTGPLTRMHTGPGWRAARCRAAARRCRRHQCGRTRR